MGEEQDAQNRDTDDGTVNDGHQFSLQNKKRAKPADEHKQGRPRTRHGETPKDHEREAEVEKPVEPPFFGHEQNNADERDTRHLRAKLSGVGIEREAAKLPPEDVSTSGPRRQPVQFGLLQVAEAQNVAILLLEPPESGQNGPDDPGFDEQPDIPFRDGVDQHDKRQKEPAQRKRPGVVEPSGRVG